MWDLDTAVRVRERKMAEMGKIVNYTNEDRKAKLLGELGRDICICNGAVSGHGVCVIPSVPITDRGYRSALTGQDLTDEEALDSIRISPPQLTELLSEAFRMAGTAASEDRAAPYKEALETVKEELAAARDSVEDLSSRLEFALSRSESAECRCDELAETVNRLESELIETRKPLSEKDAASRCMDKFQELVSSIRAMKLSIMDGLIDDAMSGKADADLCDEAVVTLKEDLKVLDALCSPEMIQNQADGDLAIIQEYESRLDEEGRALEECFRRLTSLR
jgi:chromosome segregation ATPase